MTCKGASGCFAFENVQMAPIRARGVCADFAHTHTHTHTYMQACIYTYIHIYPGGHRVHHPRAQNTLAHFVHGIRGLSLFRKHWSQCPGTPLHPYRQNVFSFNVSQTLVAMPRHTTHSREKRSPRDSDFIQWNKYAKDTRALTLEKVCADAGCVGEVGRDRGDSGDDGCPQGIVL